MHFTKIRDLLKKTAVKRAFAVFAVLLFVYCGCRCLNYMLIDDSDQYTRLMMHEFYSQDNIDVLFVGASHGTFGVDPELMGNLTGKKVFNACSYEQYPDATLALIKEADRLYDLEEIYFEVSINVAELTGYFKDRQSLVSTYLISDHMVPSVNKLSYLLNASSADHYVNSFFPARREFEKIADIDYIAEILEKKSTSKYKDYSYYYVNLNKDREYRGKGYMAFFEDIEDHGFFMRTGGGNSEPKTISRDWISTIYQIIDYCQSRHIKLTLYNAPFSDFGLSGMKGYDDYLSFLQEIFEGKDVNYVDFNLVKAEYFPYIQKNYNDSTHFNENGARAFSAFLADHISGKIPEDAYYASVSEKFSQISPCFYGMRFRDDYDAAERKFSLASSRDDYYEYRVSLITSSGEQLLIQDYDTNTDFSIPFDLLDGCELVVTFRRAGSPEQGEDVHFRDMEKVYGS